ncbi:MAG: BTAD domain-containing putative transcriptional regulator [Gemmatimonadota bacterium]
MFRLKLFGSPSIDGPDGPLSGRAVQRRRLALLALLAVARQRGLTREKLIGYLWPDSDTERARHLLSDSIYRINQAVGGEAIVAVGEELRLDPALLPSDVWEYAEALERRDWRRAAELHAEPFLDGFFLTGADELERWVDAEREALVRARARALEALAEAEEQSGRLAEAVGWWRALAGQDPYSSRVALRLMLVLERNGEGAAALRHAQAHAALLKEELGLEPDAQLLAFSEELRTGPQKAAWAVRERAVSGPSEDRPNGASTVSTLQTVSRDDPAPLLRGGGVTPAGPGPGRRMPRSVAVLPFVNLSSDPENDYFADGITEDVIAQLSKIGALSVISRASMMRFKDRAQNTREIGETLGAATLLGGSVRRSGERVRVVARLVDAATSECLWSETYDRRLTDVFAIQTDVALQIGAALQAQLSPAERTRIGREPTHSLRAYQLYLRGRSCFVRFTPQGLQKAITYFAHAIELDPGYALAHVGTAMAYEELAEIGALEPDAAHGPAREAAARALSLDEDLAEAHCILGQIAMVADFDWEGAEREFMRALALSPSSADTCDLYGRMCSSIGRYDEGVAMGRRAQELDPLAHRADFATALLRAGRYDEALEEAVRGVEFDPGYDRARTTLGWAYILKGMQAEGLAELEAAVALSPGNTAWLAQLGQAYAMVGRPVQARDVLRRLHALARERYVSSYHLAYVHTGLGEDDLAIGCLERAYEERAGAVYGIKGSFLFARLRSHPRFQALLRRLNVSAAPQAAAS